MVAATLGVIFCLGGLSPSALAADGTVARPIGAVLEFAAQDESREADPEQSSTEQRLITRSENLLDRVWKPVLFASLICLAAVLVLTRRRFGAAVALPLGVYPGLAAVLLAAFCYLAAQSLGQLLLPGLGRIDRALAVPLASFLAQLGALALGLWLFRSGLRRPFEVLGFHGRQALPASAMALLVFVAQLPAFLIMVVVNNHLVESKFQDQVVHIAENADGLYRGLYFVAVVLLAPPLEELVFRSLLLPPLRRRLGVTGGVVVSSLLFMLVHPPQTWLPIFWLGVVLGLAYHYTGNLLAPVLIHAVHNAVQFGLILWLVSGA
jgi:membrane protease YdiL (CAAX protease family)